MEELTTMNMHTTSESLTVPQALYILTGLPWKTRALREKCDEKNPMSEQQEICCEGKPDDIDTPGFKMLTEQAGVCCRWHNGPMTNKSTLLILKPTYDEVMLMSLAQVMLNKHGGMDGIHAYWQQERQHTNTVLCQYLQSVIGAPKWHAGDVPPIASDPLVMDPARVKDIVDWLQPLGITCKATYEADDIHVRFTITDFTPRSVERMKEAAEKYSYKPYKPSLVITGQKNSMPMPVPAPSPDYDAPGRYRD